MRQCALCGKKSKMGTSRKLLRGHYNPVNRERKYPNLQWLRIPGKSGRILACAKCIKLAGKRGFTSANLADK